MPEYLSPGVYVEEVPSGAKPIQGVGTDVAAFVGPARSGPFNQAIGPLGSLAEFARVCGDAEAIGYATPLPNLLWHAARTFFLEGGKTLWVVRVGEGTHRPDAVNYARGLAVLETVEAISIVAAPGATYRADGFPLADGLAVSRLLLAHAERAGSRIALLDPPDGQTAAEACGWRGHFDSTHGALCYPWIEILESDHHRRRFVPPSSVVAGIYARTDLEEGVHVAPARALARAAVGLEGAIAEADAAALAEAGINVLAGPPGRGILLQGACMLSSDPDWRYVNVRRYCLYLEQSIDKGLQWAVFEPYGEALWAAVRKHVETFLMSEWRRGALHGARPEEAWFVRCDRTTMTQDDLDNGRLACLIGIAPLRPAEFVILRIAQTRGEPRDGRTGRVATAPHGGILGQDSTLQEGW